MKKKLYILAMAVCLVVFCVSAFQLIRYYLEARAADKGFEQLTAIVEQARQQVPIEQESETEDGEEEPAIDPRDQAILDAYQELHRQNEDMIGWITVEGTKVDYPVMYTPDNPNFYLDHNFEKEADRYGVPYVAEHCDIEKPSDNLIIYGHHMKNGSMFTGLMSYRDKDFYEEHKTIQFDTLTERAQYEIVTVFLTTVYDEVGFRYYEFTDAQDEAEFDQYIDQCKRLSLYDTGVTAEYGDKLITLSTCEYSNKNGRLVVVAKKME